MNMNMKMDMDMDMGINMGINMGIDTDMNMDMNMKIRQRSTAPSLKLPYRGGDGKCCLFLAKLVIHQYGVMKNICFEIVTRFYPDLLRDYYFF
jgi:hypothetical protein